MIAYQIKNKPISEDKIRALQNLGFIIPSVELGGDVYIVHRKKSVKARVTYIGLGEDGIFSFNVVRGKIPDSFQVYQFQDTDIGKMVFLTEEEAQNSLKEK